MFSEIICSSRMHIFINSLKCVGYFGTSIYHIKISVTQTKNFSIRKVMVTTILVSPSRCDEPRSQWEMGVWT
jgi:hypothetical protein